MAYADYLHCPGCDGKAIYLPGSDVPEDVETWHRNCLREALADVLPHLEADVPLTGPSAGLVNADSMADAIMQALQERER